MLDLCMDRKHTDYVYVNEDSAKYFAKIKHYFIYENKLNKY